MPQSISTSAQGRVAREATRVDWPNDPEHPEARDDRGVLGRVTSDAIQQALRRERRREWRKAATRWIVVSFAVVGVVFGLQTLSRSRPHGPTSIVVERGTVGSKAWTVSAVRSNGSQLDLRFGNSSYSYDFPDVPDRLAVEALVQPLRYGRDTVFVVYGLAAEETARVEIVGESSVGDVAVDEMAARAAVVPLPSSIEEGVVAFAASIRGGATGDVIAKDADGRVLGRDHFED